MPAVSQSADGRGGAAFNSGHCGRLPTDAPVLIGSMRRDRPVNRVADRQLAKGRRLSSGATDRPARRFLALGRFQMTALDYGGRVHEPPPA